MGNSPLVLKAHTEDSLSLSLSLSLSQTLKGHYIASEYIPLEKELEIPGRWGWASKDKMFKAKYRCMKLRRRGGVGVRENPFHGEGMDIFSATTCYENFPRKQKFKKVSGKLLEMVHRGNKQQEV